MNNIQCTKKAIKLAITLLASKGLKYRPSDFEKSSNFTTITNDEVLVHLGFMDERNGNGSKLYAKRNSFHEENIQVLTSYIIMHFPLAQLEEESKLFTQQARPKANPQKPIVTYDDREKRYLKYLETKNMFGTTIEVCEGELKVIVDVLADYADLVGAKIAQGQCDPMYSAFWEIQIRKIREIKGKIEKAMGYDRDFQLRKCQKKELEEQNNDVGGDALDLLVKRQRQSKSGGR